MAGIVGTLQQRLNDLLARNTDALDVLAMTLRTDPGDPIEQLTAPRPATPMGSMIPIDPAPGTGAAAVGATGIDADNLSRLAADLQSADIATLAPTYADGLAVWPTYADVLFGSSGPGDLLPGTGGGDGGSV